MDELLKERLNLLRNRIPIGINGAIKLLKECNGNIDQACTLFKKQASESIKKKISFEVNDEDIEMQLTKFNYDIEKAFTALFEQKYSMTERILLTNRNQEKTLSIIAGAIEREDNLTRKYWLDLDEVKLLNTYRRCLITIVEWIDYKEWEGFDYAICRDDWTKEIIIQLRDQLQLESIANKIEEALSISKKFYEIKRSITERPPIDKYNSFFDQQKEAIYGRLIQYVKDNINEFPKE